MASTGAPPRSPPPPPPPSPPAPRSPWSCSSSPWAHRRHRAPYDRHACRRPAVARSLAFATTAAVFTLLLFVAAFAAAKPPLPPAPRTQSSAPKRIEDVGGVLAKIGPEYKSEVHTVSNAYRATLGGSGKKHDAVYKALKPGKKWGELEVAATRTGIRADVSFGFFGCLLLVGEKGLSEYLASASKDPAARRKFKAAGDMSLAAARKPKLSENIYKQVKLHEKSVGYFHGDIHPGNIRITEKKQLADGLSQKSIRDECKKHGFAFRSIVAAGSRIFRRAPTTAACGTKDGGATEAV
ncbi:hypothetical protein DFJ73DRAFT_784979 [Zopfochytrium polystomum]|nr:hypothetical protein DFJ73DRAFT_784979 [Zopfochytrium polystomum]